MAMRAVPGIPPAGEIHPKPNERPWLGVRFTCSGAYQRVYRSADGSLYLARCPKCSQCMRFRVSGDGQGTDQRFFNVSC
ncbi:MAG: hypothetical protein AB8C13_02380 [Phycisphaerales bacterium]